MILQVYRLLVFLLNIDLIITVSIIYVLLSSKALNIKKKFKLEIKIYSAKRIKYFFISSLNTSYYLRNFTKFHKNVTEYFRKYINIDYIL
jgi:hypothetical protein